MNDKIALVAVFSVFAIIIAGCTSPKAGEWSYMEVARIKEGCPQGVCQTEYIVLFNGLVFSKISGESWAVPVTTLAIAAQPEAAKVIALAGEFPTLQNSCYDCPGYHVFYADGARSETVSFKSVAGDDEAKAAGLDEAASALAEKAEPIPLFFVHLVYWKAGRNTITDYHVFGDKSVLVEDFDPKLNMIGARLYEISDGELDELKRKYSPETLRSIAKNEDCSGAYNYAYLEAQTPEGYLDERTCGLSGSPAAGAFNSTLEILEKYR